MECKDCIYADRIVKLEDKVSDLEKTTAVTSDRYNTILSVVNGLTVDIKSLLNSGGKKWDSLKWIIVTCVATTLLNNLLTLIIP